ncbi:hypothetical protein LQG66_37135 [Bradyrhizobium ontarionense]|uniref:Uncharacterized protein n=1 Tax=Bradyrhizobium ontarionense TaxID=2898149 RepID=A0ABY3RCS3_9BRAD|nr:hypothetical protein [Bradyrhizobium sp. A19]UFZ04740.1 hypothetical protein LQG66_37135 [Bradyrhizobium sp. A19]
MNSEKKETRIFFAAGLDRANQLENAGELRILAKGGGRSWAMMSAELSPPKRSSFRGARQREPGIHIHDNQ